MFGIGVQELFLVFMLVLLLFGARRIPELARGIGKAMNEFNKAKTGIEDSIDIAVSESKEQDGHEAAKRQPSVDQRAKEERKS